LKSADKKLTICVAGTAVGGLTDANFGSREATTAQQPLLIIFQPDVVKPTITVPANVTTTADLGTNTASNVALGSITASDLNGIKSISNNTPTVYPVGTTTVTWTVIDNYDNTATATQLVTVLENQTPIITSPVANAIYNAPASITINTNVNDVDSSVNKVEFFQGSTKLGEDITAPYSFVWTNVAAGSYAITAKSTDNSGAIATSDIVNVTVNALPTVSITSPTDNAKFHTPTSITISADAADADGTISKVEFFQGTTKLGEATTAPYNFNWSGAAVGSYAITAKATDNNGGISTSSAINVIIGDGSVTAVADTYVRNGSYANTNYGTSTDLTVKNSVTDYAREAYIKFNVSSMVAASTEAIKLKLNIKYAGATVTSNTWSVYYVPNDSWTESGTTWNNKPAVTTLLGTIQGQASGVVELDVTTQVLAEMTSDGIISLKIVSNGNGATMDAIFSSRETTDSSLRPQLVVTNGNSARIANVKTTNTLHENVDKSDVFVYPNPVNDNFQVNISDKLESNAKINIYTLLGNKIRDISFTNLLQEVFVGDLPVGTYLVVIQNGDRITNKKIIKK
jgi:hypothetical protein